MTRLAQNKSTLHRHSRALQIYERFLPSLDLKRRQLIAERSRSHRSLREARDALLRHRALVGEQLAMLATARDTQALRGLACVEHVELGWDNVVGTRLPAVRELRIGRPELDTWATPHWLDGLQRQLVEALKLEVRATIEARRCDALEHAVVKITQRVNLFERVLIPRTRQDMSRIRLSLSDAERAAVVRAKLAKKRAEERTT